MKFYKALFFVSYVSLIISGCASNFFNEKEIMYKWKHGNLVHIFNTTSMLFSEEGVEYLTRKNGIYSDFGGDFKFCTSQEYLCVIGGIAAAVPKNMNGQTHWVYENWTCQSKQPIYEKEIVSISCSYKGQVTDFTYSSLKGIISYTNRGNATIKEMGLVDDIGLLSK